jgi:transposase
MPDPVSFASCAAPAPHILGCDVAKREVVIRDTRSGLTHRIANTAAALTAALDQIREAGGPPDLVVCETTGGHERLLCMAAIGLGLPIHRADAARVKAFIESHGGRAKTDAIDAAWLARYGCERLKTLALWRPPEPAREAIATCMRHRQAVLARRTAAKNRLGAPGQDAVADLLEAEIDFHSRQVAALDARIGELAAQCEDFERDEKALRAIKSIGPVFARSLLAFIPELGSLSAKAAASLAGLAPHPHESGQTRRKKPASGGRADIRPVAFMASLSAARSHPELSAFYNRLITAGKPKRLALAAVARKLIVIANAVLKQTRNANPRLT